MAKWLAKWVLQGPTQFADSLNPPHWQNLAAVAALAVSNNLPWIHGQRRIGISAFLPSPAV